MVFITEGISPRRITPIEPINGDLRNNQTRKSSSLGRLATSQRCGRTKSSNQPMCSGITSPLHTHIVETLAEVGAFPAANKARLFELCPHTNKLRLAYSA